jgi:hypothetical protein
VGRVCDACSRNSSSSGRCDAQDQDRIELTQRQPGGRKAAGLAHQFTLMIAASITGFQRAMSAEMQARSFFVANETHAFRHWRFWKWLKVRAVGRAAECFLTWINDTQ